MLENRTHAPHKSTRDHNKELPELYIDRENCCGCSSCYASCPTKAINMKPDEEGFLYPVIDTEKCIGCNKCLSVCAFKNDQKAKGYYRNGEKKSFEQLPMYKVGQFEKPYTYAVKHRDIDVRMSSRSGGVFTALSDHVLNEGGVVYGCILDKNFKAIHVRAENAETRNLMRGSKYIQSEMNDVYLEVKRDLQAGLKVLFSGTSCQIAGLKGYLKKDYENLLNIDIVCHGVPSPLVWKKYLEWQGKRLKSNIVDVDFRNKKDFGWQEHVETLTCESGRCINSRVFATIFYGHSILRPSCYKCPYKDIMHPGDITIADYWGIEKAAPGFSDNKGVSMILINNQKGNDMFENVAEKVDLRKTRLEDSMQYPLCKPFDRPNNRDEVWNDILNKDFEICSKKYGGNDIISKLKRIKHTLKTLIVGIL